MPPELRNHRFPTGAETPPSTAASSLDTPAATSRQNRHRFSRCYTGGRPGQDNFCRVDRADFRRPVTMNTSKFGVLWRPVESAQYVAVKYSERLAGGGNRAFRRKRRRLSTTPSPKRSTAFTRPCSLIGADRGAASKRVNSPPSNGSIGSTIDGFWSPSATCQPKPGSSITPCWTNQPWLHN